MKCNQNGVCVAETRLPKFKDKKFQVILDDESNEKIVPIPKTQKQCLKCDKKFMAESKFNRICEPCKNSFEWRNITIYTLPNRKKA